MTPIQDFLGRPVIKGSKMALQSLCFSVKFCQNSIWSSQIPSWLDAYITWMVRCVGVRIVQNEKGWAEKPAIGIVNDRCITWMSQQVVIELPRVQPPDYSRNPLTRPNEYWNTQGKTSVDVSRMNRTSIQVPSFSNFTTLLLKGYGKGNARNEMLDGEGCGGRGALRQRKGKKQEERYTLLPTQLLWRDVTARIGRLLGLNHALAIIPLSHSRWINPISSRGSYGPVRHRFDTGHHSFLAQLLLVCPFWRKHFRKNNPVLGLWSGYNCKIWLPGRSMRFLERGFNRITVSF